MQRLTKTEWGVLRRRIERGLEQAATVARDLSRHIGQGDEAERMEAARRQCAARDYAGGATGPKD